ncbi:hypothetical protein HWV62_6835 [Athelia sp. TMB]|nr:hypothetical protein HWV62_6835 [Athelia sp. TMB]
MSYAYVTQEEANALMNVTVESLAKFCGISADGEHTDDGNIVNLKRQLGILQQQPRPAQFKIHQCVLVPNVLPAAITRYLPVLTTAYKASTGPSNAPMTMLNLISYTPYFVRFQRTPAGADLASFQAHRTASAAPEATAAMDIDTVGEIVQFLATLMLLQGTAGLGLSEGEEKSLLKILKGWETQYRRSGRVAEKASGRCIALLTCKSGLPEGYDAVKDEVEKGVERLHSPPPNGNAVAVRKCGKEHQKQAWSAHKSLCFKPAF